MVKFNQNFKNIFQNCIQPIIANQSNITLFSLIVNVCLHFCHIGKLMFYS